MSRANNDEMSYIMLMVLVEAFLEAGIQTLLQAYALCLSYLEQGLAHATPVFRDSVQAAELGASVTLHHRCTLLIAMGLFESPHPQGAVFSNLSVIRVLVVEAGRAANFWNSCRRRNSCRRTLIVSAL